MNNADQVQTWTRRVKHNACEAGGRIDMLVTEILDWNARTITSFAQGIHDGELVDSREKETSQIHTCATPEAAARYRATHGYARIK